MIRQTRQSNNRTYYQQYFDTLLSENRTDFEINSKTSEKITFALSKLKKSKKHIKI